MQVWLNKGDGFVRSPMGKVMTQEAFDAAFPNARHITLNIPKPKGTAGGMDTTEP
jgi:hypothetical protein